MKRHISFGKGILVIAGVYLIYLGIRMLYDNIRGSGSSSGSTLVMTTVAAVIFIVAGAVFVIPTVRTFLRERNNPDNSEEYFDAEENENITEDKAEGTEESDIKEIPESQDKAQE